MKIKVGILGSCVSRDVFNSQFIPNYKDFFEVTISAPRISMISLMQDPLDVDKNSLKILPNTRENVARSNFILYDLNRNLLVDLIEKEIDYLVIDNYFEVTMGVMYFQDDIITHNGDLSKTKFYQKISDKFIFSIEKYPNEYFQIWVKYCHLFFNFLEIYCPNVRVILNKARVIDNIVKDDGTIKLISEYTENANIINPFLDKLDSYIEQNFDVDVINHDFKNISLDENHLWGIAQVHYSMNYYYSLFKNILKIVDGDKDHSNLNKSTFELMKKFNSSVKELNLETKLVINKLIIKKLKDSQNFIKIDSNSNLIKYCTGRIDIKNQGLTFNSIEIIENSDNNLNFDNPDWFSDSNGVGTVIQSFKGKLHLKIKCIGEGLLTIYLRGPDIRDRDGKRFPVFIDFIEFQFNNKDIISENKLVCHDVPYEFKKHVRNNEIIDLQLKWMPFNRLSKFIS